MMSIVCPHCATSYNIDADKLGDGRTVRCAKCKETWFAKPQPLLAMAGEVEWTEAPAPQAEPRPEPQSGPALGDIESPPLAADLPMARDPAPSSQAVALPPATPVPFIDVTPPRRPPHDRRRSDPKNAARSKGTRSLPIAAAAMVALIAALIMWRGDVVKLLPQTAIIYKSVGLDVNLRGVSFREVKLTSETVDGKPVLVIEGVIIDELKRPLEVPKLRFVVRDAKGTAIYAWNANAEQTVIEPGQRVPFRSRLAQPPDEAHSIDVRFFHKRDLATGAA